MATYKMPLLNFSTHNKCTRSPFLKNLLVHTDFRHSPFCDMPSYLVPQCCQSNYKCTNSITSVQIQLQVYKFNYKCTNSITSVRTKKAVGKQYLCWIDI